MPRERPPRVLIVDHEGDATRALVAFLREQGLEVLSAHDGEGALHVLGEERVDCLVTELHGSRIDGLAVLRRARERNPEVCAVVVTDHAGTGMIERAVEAMRQGAYDFQIKPLHLEKLLAVLRRGLSHQRLAARAAEMEDELDERLGRTLTGQSRAVVRVMEQVRQLASTRATVLIEGETGTGKGLVAQAIHQYSGRRDAPFVWVNCPALGESVIEGELFGEEHDAQGGAGARPGRFELADGGTLFLDEIGATPAGVQVRLLRVLQDHALDRVGGRESIHVDVRLVASTQRDLAAEVRAGRFRQDLFDRLSVVRIALPTLRERPEDIPLLVEAFLAELNRAHGRRVTGITRGALERLTAHAWPGNVRELRNVLEGMVVVAERKRPLDFSDLPPALRGAGVLQAALPLTVGMTVDEAERTLIVATLRHTDYDKPRAAAMLGIGLRTLYRKIRAYGIAEGR